MSQPVVLARDLVKSFGELRAVDGISFSIGRGECFGILGPNGAGKTSTIRMIYGFSPLSGGSLTVLGDDITSRPREAKRRIGVCQQADSLDPDLTVIENLELFASYFDIPARVARERAVELLSFMGLEHRAGAFPRTLSGGLVRRLMLARALVNDPELVMLDEPTTGLDPQSRHQVWDRLTSLKEKGLTILLTTHYMDEAQRLCDRLVIMDHGRILVEGRPADLIAGHAGSNVLEIDDPDDALRGLLSEHGTSHDDLGSRLIVYGGKDDEPLFQRILVDHCRSGCRARVATLEDVFLRLTGRDLRE